MRFHRRGGGIGIGRQVESAERVDERVRRVAAERLAALDEEDARAETGRAHRRRDPGRPTPGDDHVEALAAGRRRRCRRHPDDRSGSAPDARPTRSSSSCSRSRSRSSSLITPRCQISVTFSRPSRMLMMRLVPGDGITDGT